MDKIYGFKDKDIIELAKYIKDKKGSRVNIFKEYSLKSGKAEGSVRNLYYALVKISNSDKEFTKKYFNGIPLKAKTVKSFTISEEKKILKNILLKVKDGLSVRSAINELTNGNTKLALRYQNKYRNIIKNNISLYNEVVSEIEKEYGKVFIHPQMRNQEKNEFAIKKVSEEINSLVDRIVFNIKKENEYLKNKIFSLECDNSRLSNMIGDKKEMSALNYFKFSEDNNSSN
ncbi:MAG: hypothetical protein MJ066_03370 [Clostridia bacterium]|nr:hypothetical protein [Clostridia bacterium]